MQDKEGDEMVNTTSAFKHMAPTRMTSIGKTTALLIYAQ